VITSAGNRKTANAVRGGYARPAREEGTLKQEKSQDRLAIGRAPEPLRALSADLSARLRRLLELSRTRSVQISTVAGGELFRTV
jgi:hypothetical protein